MERSQIVKPSLEDLAHFGVRGMHWGVRRAETSGGSSGGHAGPSAKKVAKQQKNEARNSEIDKARASVAARQREELMASQIKSGRERTKVILAAIGAVGFVTLVHIAKARADLNSL